MTPFEQFLSDNAPLSKGEVAKYLGISPSNISMYCKGKKIPSATIKKLSAKWNAEALTPVLKENESTSTHLDGNKALRDLYDLIQTQIAEMDKIIRLQQQEIIALNGIVSLLSPESPLYNKKKKQDAKDSK